MFDKAFANIAAGFSARYGGPYFSGAVKRKGVPVMDDGGSITTPGTPSSTPCTVQVTAPSEAMRLEEGFRENDVGLRILVDQLDGDATVDVTAGKHAGSYSIESLGRDTAGIGWICRGRQI